MEAKPEIQAIRALEAIEALAGDDFCESLEHELHCSGFKLTEKEVRERLKVCEEKIGRIYMISHSEISSHCCYHVHGDWRSIKDDILAASHQKEKA